MTIDKNASMTSMENSQVNTLNSILDNLHARALSFKSTSILPTATTVQEGELVVYDDGAGTKRLYVISAKGNLGFVALT